MFISITNHHGNATPLFTSLLFTPLAHLVKKYGNWKLFMRSFSFSVFKKNNEQSYQ